MSSKRCSPPCASRLDHQVAGAHQPLEQVLVEEHRVDPFERDLDAALGDDPLAVDAAVGGDDEVGRVPLDQPLGQVQEADDQSEDRHPLGARAEPSGPALHEQEDPERDRQHHPDHRPHQHDPVGVLVDDDLLVGVQVAAVVGHGRQRNGPIRHRRGIRCQRALVRSPRWHPRPTGSCAA
jgi:hypothetical protein